MWMGQRNSSKLSISAGVVISSPSSISKLVRLANVLKMRDRVAALHGGSPTAVDG